MRQLKYYRLSQAADYYQADRDGATVTVDVNTPAWKFGTENGELSRIIDIISKTVDMMDGSETIAWRLMDGDRLLDTFNEPVPKMAEDEEAFAKAYDSNVAIHDGHTIREFLVRARSDDWDYMAEGFPSAMMDAWRMWHAAKESVKNSGTNVPEDVCCPSCGYVWVP